MSATLSERTKIELDALERIALQMERLDTESQKRVLNWLDYRYPDKEVSE